MKKKTFMIAFAILSVFISGWINSKENPFQNENIVCSNRTDELPTHSCQAAVSLDQSCNRNETSPEVMPALPSGRDYQPQSTAVGYVDIRETTITIPTYEMDIDNPYPFFNQWDEATIYPYPRKDLATWKKSPKDYIALVMENEYLKVVVLPELGGRLYQFYDKVNKRDIIYTNRVVKPGYFGRRGGWISGGFEFNFPRAHSTTTICPIDYHIRKNPDGSASIFIGDVEREYRMKWQVRLTLYPNMSFLQQDTKLDNRTPLPHRYHWWTIVAVHPNDNTQVVFPAARIINHPQHYILTWPLWRGLDISRYKTLLHRFGSDWSMLQPWDGFFAYYDHGIDAGLIHVGNKHLLQGSKYFSYHNTTSGRFHSAFVMSDEDGPYDEIDSGLMLTQHDYRILNPFEVIQFTEYWYPGNKLGGLKKAVRDAAVNIWREGDVIKVAINVNRQLRNAHLIVNAGEQSILEKPLDLLTGVAYRMEVPSQPGILSLRLVSSTGEEILTYRDEPIDESKLPPEGPVTPRERDENKMSAEQMYLEGMLYMEHEIPHVAERWFKKALVKDSGFTSARNQMGIIYLKRGLWKEAIAEFEKSLKRKQHQGIPHYYIGLCYKLQGDLTTAKEHLWESVRYQETFSLAHRILGEIALAEGKAGVAYDHFNQALSVNPHSSDTKGLLSVALRLLGRSEDAGKIVEQIQSNDPTNHLAAFEKILLQKSPVGRKTAENEFIKLMRDNDYSYANLAHLYANCGLFSDAIHVLNILEARKKKEINPLVYYQLSYLHEKLGQNTKHEKEIKRYLESARTVKNWSYVFPNCIEDFAILKTALINQPNDYCARYALGNLLTSRYRYEEAIEQFRQALSDAEKDIHAGKEINRHVISVTHRNLAFLLWKTRNRIDEAIKHYKKAIEYGGNHHQCYLELAQLYAEKKDTSLAIKILESGLRKVIDPSDLILALTGYWQKEKAYDKILNLVPKYKYDHWKGLTLQRVVRAARLGKAKEYARKEKLDKAVAELERATKITPENIPVMGKLVHEFAEVLWWRGQFYEKLGRLDEARKSWAEAENEIHDPISPLNFFQAKCLQRIGKTAEASAILERMLFFANLYVERYPQVKGEVDALSPGMDEKNLAYYKYLQALAHEGLGNIEKAITLYEEVLKIIPTHEEALEQLQIQALKK